MFSRALEFPFFSRKICLTHASVAPLPARSARAIADYALQISQEGQFDFLHSEIYNRCKIRLAQMIGPAARPEEVAFAGSTSHALGLVATSFPWRAGDNCVVFDGDFPANVVVWKNLSHTHGVEVRVVPFREGAAFTPADLEPFLDSRTRLVTLSAVHFLTGAAPSLCEFAEFLHARDIRFCVDAIQAFGAVQSGFEAADFVCADAHKWMLGPNGAAFLWTRGQVLETMRPQILGWLATRGRDDWLAYDTTPHPSAERFEPGARNYLGIVGMESSLAILQEFGIDNVEKQVRKLRDYSTQSLAELDVEVLWARPEKSGNLSFRPRNGRTRELYDALDARFALSLRSWRDGRDWIRLSPHFMNTNEDIDEMCAAIAAFTP